MKKLVLLIALVCSLVLASTANAWHANDVTVSALCNVQTGVYDVSAVISQSAQWPGATVKSVTPSSFAGNTVGTRAVVVVVQWSNGETWTAPTKYVNLNGTCSKVCEPITVYVDRVVTNTVYVDREVPVEKVVEKIVYVPKVVTKTVVKYKTIVKWKTKTVVKWKYKTKRCKPPAPPRCEGDCSQKKLHEGGSG